MENMMTTISNDILNLNKDGLDYSTDNQNIIVKQNVTISSNSFGVLTAKIGSALLNKGEIIGREAAVTGHAVILPCCRFLYQISKNVYPPKSGCD